MRHAFPNVLAIPGLLALGAGGTLLKKRKGGAGKSRNFSLVGGAGPAPSTGPTSPTSPNSQTRPETPAKPAQEASANKK